MPATATVGATLPPTLPVQTATPTSTRSPVTTGTPTAVPTNSPTSVVTASVTATPTGIQGTAYRPGPFTFTDISDTLALTQAYLHLYNRTSSSTRTAGWQVCTHALCLPLPTLEVSSFTLVRIPVSSITGWPSTGLNHSQEMLGLKNANGIAVDSVNWGALDTQWPLYGTFYPLLWDPGINVLSPSGGTHFFIGPLGDPYPTPASWFQIPFATPSPTVTVTPSH